MFGILPPISAAGPTIEELRSNDDMDFYLSGTNSIFETELGQLKRDAVFRKLSNIIGVWSSELAIQKNVSENYIPAPEAIHIGVVQLHIFGSTRLGVHNVDSDIDILCLAPSYISRNDFFTSFRAKLMEEPGAESILSIPEAYTPVLKFTLNGQSIDMVFASLQIPVLPSGLDILDLRCLQGLDDQSVRSLNGARVAEWICRLIPNMKTFCVALRVVKHWARRRGLYSNVLGFLGGVNFAILVALVCQLYPTACPFTLISKFFTIFSMWRWPNPVILRDFEDLQLKDAEGRLLPVWNPKTNFKDSTHIMPIITPAYPAMNSAYNISPPQFRTIQVIR